MLSGIKNSIRSVNQVLGVHAIIQDSGNTAFSFCHLKKVRGKIELIECKNDCSVDDIIKKGLPIALIVSGEGVLLKTTENLTGSDITVSGLMPGINADAFYLSTLTVDTISYSAVARRESVENVIHTLKNAIILMIDIGPISVLRSIDTLLSSPEKLNTKQYQIERIADRWNIKRNESNFADTSLNIGGTHVEGNSIVEFCAACEFLISDDTGHGVISEAVTNDRESFYQKSLFENGIKACLGFLFVVLLLNFGAFSFFSSQNETLREQAIALGAGGHSEDTLIAELNNKKAFLKDAGWLDNSAVSFYSDKLSLSRPEAIRWTQLTVYPKYKKEDDGLSFLSKTIRIKGETGNAYELNQWQKTLSRISWLKRVDLEYLKKKDEAQLNDFSLLIELK